MDNMWWNYLVTRLSYLLISSIIYYYHVSLLKECEIFFSIYVLLNKFCLFDETINCCLNCFNVNLWGWLVMWTSFGSIIFHRQRKQPPKYYHLGTSSLTLDTCISYYSTIAELKKVYVRNQYDSSLYEKLLHG